MSLLKMEIAQNKLTTSISEMNSNKKFLLEHLIEAAVLSNSGKVKPELGVTSYDSNLWVTSSNPRFTSSNPRDTISNPLVTS